MAYPIAGNLNNMSSYAGYMNTVTGGYFWTLVLFGAFITFFSFMYSRNRDFGGSIFVASFACFIAGFYLMSMGVISPLLELLFFIGTALGGWAYKSQQT